MSEVSSGDAAPAFDPWEPILDQAVALAERYPEPYRIAILEALLRGFGPTASQLASSQLGTEPRFPRDKPQAGGRDPVRKAAQRAGVDPDALARIIHVGEDGALRLLAAVGGDSKAETANRAAAVYLFIKEHGFGEFDVDIEEIRQVVIDQGGYDAPNFTRNLRNYPWLLEIGKRGSPNKQYRLSGKGQDAAKEILREMLES